MWMKAYKGEVRTINRGGEEWIPDPGQGEAVDFLVGNNAAALWADPGAGKTSIALTAKVILDHKGLTSGKTLIVAPLRVCQLQWRQEADKWSHTRDLTFTLLHGPKKHKLLQEDTDIHIINYEGLAWLVKVLNGKPWPYDTVIFDEITKMKNSQSIRSKKMRKFLPFSTRIWGLTGTPSPNGYLDLFGQFLILDQGAALGKYYSRFRETFFKPDYSGFNWELQKGADDRIKTAIEHMVFRLEYDAIPVRDDVRPVQMDPTSRAIYDEFKKELLIELDGETLTAANSAAVHGKLKQMANGAVYTNSETKEYAVIHDAKLDALEELIEELQERPLFVAYEYQHDLKRLQERFPHAEVLGNGQSAAKAEALQDKWNRGEVSLMLAHPASVGHGLNLQEGGANHVCWFSAGFDFEHYEQFIRRLRRKGNSSKYVMNHLLLVLDTIDEDAVAALKDKDATQARLLQSVRRALGLKNPDGGKPSHMEGGTMPVIKRKSSGRLPRQEELEDEHEEEVSSGGWGGKRAAPEEDDVVDRAAVKKKLTRKPEPEEEDEDEEGDEEDASPVLSAKVRAALRGEDDEEDEDEEDEKPLPKRLVKKPAIRPKVKTADESVGEVDNSTKGEQAVSFGSTVSVEVRFYGDPAAVRAAMAKFLVD